jgi:transposase
MVMALADPLPEDAEALRGLLRSVIAERDAALVEREVLAEQNDRLRHLLRQLQRMQFGRRSEKLDPDQLQFALEDIKQAVAHGTAEAEKRAPQLRSAVR